MAGRVVAAAGTNGAGKSSIVQPFIRSTGGFYFNPDEMTRDYQRAGMTLDEANAAAWNENYRRLRTAIDDDKDYSFETTLGGSSIPFEMMRALAMGRGLFIFYVGLASVDLHLQRVAERVRRQGHSIPEAKIRQRYDDSRERLLSFIGTHADMKVWDNSEQMPDGTPRPRLMFSIADRRLLLPTPHIPDQVPGWIKPLLTRAMQFCEPGAKPAG